MIEHTLKNMDWKMLYVGYTLLGVKYDGELTLDFQQGRPNPGFGGFERRCEQ